uniref:NADH-ubiquinone oxidoreductase chain 4 n=1 Tax=Macrostemum floridum TaxID=486976 RepID=A0A7L8XEM6_9NEOP|nr:NADH dehydrogenase subunit 4 [Macrostemum floridum]QOH91260.1 NADH dehydrogenase subunit 4 [Macrostemum floridum]
MMKFMFYMIFMYFISDYWVLLVSSLGLIFLFMMMSSFSFIFSNLSLNMGLDYISMNFVLLLMWIVMLMLLSSLNILKYKKFLKFYMFNILTMMLFIYMAFIFLNFFFFFFFFEGSMIPILIFIIGWGGNFERVQAGMYLIFYTLFMSLPLLISLIILFNDKSCLLMMYVFEVNNMLLYFFLILAFLVKMPMFVVHLWLPKAHVEAPVFGSMILAGIMLKLGGYGIIRVMMSLISVNLQLSYIFSTISLLGGMCLSLVCLYQVDMKMLIAYSSVVHMSLVLLGIMSMSWLGLIGGMILMVGHGLCSSGLFFLVGVIYNRSKSRSLMLNKGFINLYPYLTLYWFLLVIINMGVPPFLNYFSELMLFINIINYSSFLMWILMLMSFFSSLYGVYLYTMSQHGKINSGLSYMLQMIMVEEYLVLFLHFLPLLILILHVNEFYSVLL